MISVPHATSAEPAPPHRLTTIALLGWAMLSLQAREGSGYNLNASELASTLASRGHRVVYLASGVRFSPLPGLRIARTQTWRNVGCYHVVNSPVLAPAAVNFRSVGRELRSPALCAAVVRWLDAQRVDVVHVHSLEGFTLDVIGAIRSSGRPVVVTPHNYWFACPQVDLLHRERRVCDDYEGGTRCVGCLEASGYRAHRLKRTAGQSLDAAIGVHAANTVRAIAYAAVDRLRRRARAADDESLERDPLFEPPPPEPPPGPSQPLDQNERFLSPMTPSTNDLPASGSRLVRQLPHAESTSADRHLRIVDGSVYGRRRAAGIEALAQASVVTPPSQFVGDVMVRMGLARERVRTIRLGQPHFDRLRQRASESPYYDTVPWHARTTDRPLRLAFLGTTRPNKGLDILIRAIRALDPALRARCQFLVRAAGWDWPFRRRVRDLPNVQFAGGYDMLQLVAAWGEYDVGILPHIWFENSPLVLLEHLHGGKFVIASRLGGPVEWIVEPTDSKPGNGLLFAGGDAQHLARSIERIVQGNVALPTPRQVHDLTPHLRTHAQHVDEVQRCYAELLARAPAATTPAHRPSGEPAEGWDAREPAQAR